MTDWTVIDNQMRVYSPFLRDDLGVSPPESNTLASAISTEIKALPINIIRDLTANDTVQFSDRLDELAGFQSFMDLASENPNHPGLVRAQVITQNYISFVYLGEACFMKLRKHTPSGSVTKRCCIFLTDNPIGRFATQSLMPTGNISQISPAWSSGREKVVVRTNH